MRSDGFAVSCIYDERIHLLPLYDEIIENRYYSGVIPSGNGDSM